MNDPIVICGCPGSGTSLVTKMLRYAGMFVGNDAGPKTDRKFHESDSFRSINNRFLTATIDFPYSPKHVRQFQDHVTKSESNMQQLLELVDRDELLKSYWGSVTPVDVWGWKDPRNSATALIWRHIFPDMRVLVIHRRWTKSMRKQKEGSKAGLWFRLESTAPLRKMYLDPPGIEGLDVHQVNFDRLLYDPSEFEQLLSWAGINTGYAGNYSDFLEMVGIES